jgi:hypothetical protein
MKIIHNECGDVAFYYTERPKPGEVIDATKATYPDGNHPTNGSPLYCWSCQRPIMTINKRTFDLTAVED